MRRLRYAPACEHTRAGRPMHGLGLCKACHERERRAGGIDPAELVIGLPVPPIYWCRACGRRKVGTAGATCPVCAPCRVTALPEDRRAVAWLGERV